MKTKRTLILIGLLAVITSLIFLIKSTALGNYLSLDSLKTQQEALNSYYNTNPGIVISSYFIIYIIVTALSIPGALLMTLAGGAIFGLLWGTIIVSFASTIGATLAFLIARLLLKDFIQKKYGNKLKAINQGIKKEGPFYLFALRLVPIFPFFLINLVMGLTPIRTLVYFLISQLGMFPGTIAYVNAGTQLSKINSLSGIISPKVLIAFAILGLLPILSKLTINFLRNKNLK